MEDRYRLRVEEERAHLFYSGKDYLRFQWTWFGRLLPKRLHHLVPVTWVGRWVR